MRKLIYILIGLIAFLSIAPAFAQQQPVNIGTSANDHTGDNARAAFTKLNANDAELYANVIATVTAGGTNTYTATPDPTLVSLVHGKKVIVTFTNHNTGASTFNANGLGAVAIKKYVSGALVALASGDISDGQVFFLIYDGTNSCWQINVGSSGGSGDVTYASLMTSRILTSSGDLDQTDNFRTVYDDAVSPINIRVDLLTAGTQVQIINRGSATATLTQGSGVTLIGTTIPIAAGNKALIIYQTAATPDVYITEDLVGDVTSFGNTTTYNNVVPSSKGGAGAVSGVLKANGSGTVSAATNADLPAMTATVGGAVPTPPNDVNKVLRGNGTFGSIPAGGIDDVLAVGQALTTSRTINLNSNALSVTNGSISIVNTGSPGGSLYVDTDASIGGTAKVGMETQWDGGPSYYQGSIKIDNVNGILVSEPFDYQVGPGYANTPRGLRGASDFTPNIQSLDYVQKKYVDDNFAGITFSGEVEGTFDGTTLAATGVTPGSYTNASITVDVGGRITSASDGSGGAGSVYNVSASVPNGLTVNVTDPTGAADIAITNTSIQTITTGTTTTISAGKKVILVNPASLLSSHTITMPASPNDQDEVIIYYGGTITALSTVVTTLTISPNSGQALLQSITPLTAKSGDAMQWKYISSITKWVRQF